MKISIAERLHPFSHRPGAQCVLPLSSWQAILYPTRILLQKVGVPSQHVILDLSVEGPVKDFTVELELEKGMIRVFGQAQKGFLRYEIRRSAEGILLTFEKLPAATLQCSVSGQTASLVEKGTFLIPLPAETESAAIPATRLSLGMHKAQDWDLVLRRFDLREILPILMRLGAMIPSAAAPCQSSGTFALLNTFQSACASRNKLQVHAACERWLQASFTGILVPTLNDTLFQGILPSSEQTVENSALLAHLTNGSRLISSLFFQQTPEHWEILPCLLPAFAAGRLINLSTGTQDVLSIEWSKHQLKKLIIQPHQARTQILKFPKEISSFRLRKSQQEKGKVFHVEGGQVEIDLPASGQLLLDSFKK